MRKIDLLVLLLSAALLAACSGGSSGSGNGIGEDLIGKWQWGSGYMHVYADGHYIYESPDYDDAEEEYVDSAYYLNGQWSVNGSSLTISKADPIGLDGSVIDDIDPCMLLNGAFDVTVTNVFLEGEGVGAGLYFGAGWEVFTTPDYELACGPLNPPNEEDYLAWVRESLIPGDYDYFPPILPTPPDDGLTDAEFYDLFGRHSRSLWLGIDFTYGGTGIGGANPGVDGFGTVAFTLEDLGFDIPIAFPTPDFLYDNYTVAAVADPVEVQGGNYSGLTRGDLIFLDYDLDDSYDHIAIYYGVTGDMTHAAVTASDYFDEVLIEDLDNYKTPLVQDIVWSNIDVRRLDHKKVESYYIYDTPIELN